MQLSDKDRVKRVIFWLLSQGVAENQEDLAKRLGYNPSSFSQIVSGIKPVSSKFLDNLCALSGKVNKNYLLGLTEDMLYEKLELRSENNLQAKYLELAEKHIILQEKYAKLLEKQ